MKKITVTACMLLGIFMVADAQTDTTKKRKKAQPRNERKKIIGKDTAGHPHNRTPQWPHDSMRKSTNKVEQLHYKKDTVNTLKQP